MRKSVSTAVTLKAGRGQFVRKTGEDIGIIVL